MTKFEFINISKKESSCSRDNYIIEDVIRLLPNDLIIDNNLSLSDLKKTMDDYAFDKYKKSKNKKEPVVLDEADLNVIFSRFFNYNLTPVFQLDEILDIFLS